MGKIKRYDHFESDNRMKPHRDGEYVMYDDVEELISKHDPVKLDLILKDKGIVLTAVCPKCKTCLNSGYNSSYCGSCGQKITWTRKKAKSK